MNILKMKQGKRKSVALWVALMLLMSSILGMTAFAAESNPNDAEEIIISNFTLKPSSDMQRTIRGYEYKFDMGDNSGNVYGSVSGVVTFDYNGTRAVVQSAGTPKVTVYDKTVKMSADTVGSTEGTTAVVTVSVTMTKHLIFSNTAIAKIKCSKDGFIWNE